MHATCWRIISKLADITQVYKDMQRKDLRIICEIDNFVGKCTGPSIDGIARIPAFENEKVCGVDIRQYWHIGKREHEISFDWKEFKAGQHAWTLARPYIFPRFFSEVSLTRLAQVALPGDKTVDVFRALPIDVIHHIVPYLDAPSFVALTATCRTMYRYALNDLQPVARRIVLNLPWATPFVHSDPPEYKSNGTMAHAIEPPHDGDWLLYLGHVHRTDSMRARRRIWKICKAVIEYCNVARESAVRSPQWPVVDARLWDAVDRLEKEVGAAKAGAAAK